MFEWIRMKVKNAVLAGVADAADVLARQGADGIDDAEDRLTDRLRLLPAPDDQSKPRRKSV